MCYQYLVNKALCTIAWNTSVFVSLTFTDFILFKKYTGLTNDDCSDLMLCFQSFLDFGVLLHIVGNVFTALHGMQRRSSDENSVRLSHACIVTKG